MIDIESSRNEYRIAIQGIDQLPTISAVFQQLVELLDSEQSTAKQLSELISQDQSITVAILKLVNSAFYGHMSEITSLDQAIVILGLNTVKSISLGTSLFKGAHKRKDKVPLNKNDLWIHSLSVGTASKIIANKIGYKDIEEAFAAGLLHDVGKVIFDAFFHKKYQEVLQHTLDKSLRIVKAEKDLLGIMHDEAGEILLLKWNLPLAIAYSVGGHHNSSRVPEEYRELAEIIKVSDEMAKNLNIGSGGDKKELHAMPTPPASLKLTQKDIYDTAMELESNKEIFEMFRL